MVSYKIQQFKMRIRITNVCARFNINFKLDLEDILNNNKFDELFSSKVFNKSKFSALIAKFKGTKLTFLLFSSGTIVLVGGKSQTHIKESIKEFKNLLNIIYNVKIEITHYKITNYCCAADFKRRIDIVSLAKEFPLCTSYETELFVNARFKQYNEMTKQNVIFTISHKGNVFCTGVSDRKNINNEFNKLYTTLKPFFKNSIKGMNR